MRKLWVLLAIFLSCGAFGQDRQSTAQSCENLEQIGMSGVKIMSAVTIAAGAFPAPASPGPPGMGPETALYKALPSFCRVMVESRASDDSLVKIEVWMPVSGWNGKLQGHGNGGFAGEINYRGLATSVRDGYAAVSTDTGHSGSAVDASWAAGHPEKVVDFGYRAIHQMTLIAKLMVKAFYGSNPQHSYFAGCSNGGRQALMEAQRFPEDYDGIVAGAPANYWTHLLSSGVWNAQATTKDPASYIPASKVPAIARAVNDACDAQDGVADGILNDPRQCRFDPAVLVCKGEDSDKCLTAPQATALKKLYNGAHDSHGNSIFPGFPPGAEQGGEGWPLWITGPAPGKGLLFLFASGYFSNIVYENPKWDIKTAVLDDAVKAADQKTAKILNATDPNLKAFKARGGKLIIYHGWDDPAISSLNTVDYYNSVAKTMGAQETDSFMRVFMVPGMQHCGGGPGPEPFVRQEQAALEQWVTGGDAPSVMVATKNLKDASGKETKITRPLCPYPQAARYKGTGDTNDAANFECAAGSH